MLIGLIIALLVIELALIGWLAWKVRIILPAKANSWLDITNKNKSDLNLLSKKQLKTESELLRIKSYLNKSLLSWAIIRFSAFSDIGANQSFSLCLLNSYKDGYIITNILTNQASRLYIKEIKNNLPLTPLSPEEKEAYQKAQRRLGLIKIKARQLKKI